MKKLISSALALCLVFALVSCGKSGTSSPETSSGDSAESFVKPEQYASVLLITINPQFRLYLDENEKVLAVEAVNKDAESIKDSISFENESFETVIEAIVTEANKNGFVKADATINFEIIESKETDKAQSDILSKAEKIANDTAVELKIEININISEIKTNNDTSSSETEPIDNQSSSKPTNDQGSSEAKPNNNQGSSEPAHTHSFSTATCTEPKKCSCGVVEGSALGHDYKDGICTRCKAKDPNFKLTSVLQKQGKWTLQYLREKQLYSVSIIVCKPGENSAGVGIGVLLSTLPPEMQNDVEIKKYCETFNGEDYYIGMGNGDNIKTVTEESNTVTLTDSLGNKLVLTRTGENTLKCASAPDSFADISEIPVGAVFTFVAE
ncbi:MAG: anti-sigma-I factor RsgI family protein [Acutalibacteraceae bacterium]|jgi:hypothetical protein